ncbi:MAG: tRNA (adenosine(37)-N6)-threonylcarbamoyltransferase complex dimerization subunit type 1 TsaB [Planctomycetes bacterium]|nr:tRNA (adenosine(37)-N6)-threonylcarbamoyltransferase complex dimerization subunit type 1 TsaB [Planctomycetota bacterium]
MYCLGIETSSIIGSVALSEDSRIIDEISFEKGLIHGRELIPNIKKILSSRNLPPEKIGLVCVSQGPGSYTGLRVGMTTAKIFSYSLKKPLIAVPSLDALVMNAPLDYDYACPVMDACWDQVYSCAYKKSKNGWQKNGEYSILPAPETADNIHKGAFVFGDALKRFRDVFEKKGRFIIGIDDAIWYPRARNICLKGFEYFKNGRHDDILKVEPMYLRPAKL